MAATEYAIAKHIPIRFRRKMVGVTYTKAHWPNAAPRCKSGRCPMGFLPGLSHEPNTRQIATWLSKNGINGARTMDLIDLIDVAALFVGAFDMGRITSLREALGVN